MIIEEIIPKNLIRCMKLFSFALLVVISTAQSCDDDRKALFKVAGQTQPKSCAWLATAKATQKSVCVPSHAAYSLCPETCGKCTDTCTEDSKAEILWNGVTFNCAWLTWQNAVRDVICVPGKLAYIQCPETCNACDAKSTLFKIVTQRPVSTYPTRNPTLKPTRRPTRRLTRQPTRRPTRRPTRIPTQNPTTRPTQTLSQKPTTSPTQTPTHQPTTNPTQGPTPHPTLIPTQLPTQKPTSNPTQFPSPSPTLPPSPIPTQSPTEPPTPMPSQVPSQLPSQVPTQVSLPLTSDKPTVSITLAPTLQETTTLPPPTIQAPNLTVGAYYYPWYGADFHRRSQYLRYELIPKQRPFLGEYNDTDPRVIAQHLTWSRQANIQLWVTSWWGPRSREDVTTLNVILPHQELGSHKIALFYETSARVKEPNVTTTLVGTDMAHLCQKYFSHPNYYRIDNRPVLFMYITRRYTMLNKLEEVLSIMRATASLYGFDPYIIGDHVWRVAPKGPYAPFEQLDAVTGYDVKGGMGLPIGMLYATQSRVNTYYTQHHGWKVAANSQGCGYVPPVTPGYNDRAIRLAVGRSALSRQLSLGDEQGSFFRASLKRACALVDHRTNNLMMINSFNEWHEDTQIEPVIGEDMTNIPFNMTQGLEYDPYGELYLDILRQETLF